MHKFLILFLLITVSFSISAKQERSSINQCEERVPTIGLAGAVDLVINYHKHNNAESTEIFIDEAKLECKNNNLIWLIGYRMKLTETGHMYVLVNMNGKVKFHTVVKDG